jgi:type IV secretion system protein VirD4
MEGLILLLVIGGIGYWIYKASQRKPAPPQKPTSHGSAEFAKWEDLEAQGLLKPQGYPLGFWRGTRRNTDGEASERPSGPLRYSGELHRLICAPTRSGKFASCVGPMLLNEVDSSALIVDVKGEAAAITGEWRGKAGPVHILDPWGISGHESAAFNPLDILAIDSPDLAEDAAMLADAIVIGTGERDHHWNEEAKALLAAVMLYVALDPAEKDQRTLIRVRELITQPKDAFKETLALMQGSSLADGLIARGAARLDQKSDDERSGCLSTAQQQTHFLDSPRLHGVLAKSTFDFAALKKGLCTIYLVLPPERLPSYNRWLRLLISFALTALARTPGKPTEPIKFVVDEFPALGQLKAVETAIGLMAGYGVQFHIICQDLSQLKDTYKDRWESFIANSGILQLFNVRDVFTAEYVAKLLGDSTVIAKGQNYGESSGSGPNRNFMSGTSYSEIKRPLLTPGEIMTLGTVGQLIFPANNRPILCRKHRWFEEAPWKERGKPAPEIFKPLAPVSGNLIVQGGVSYEVT